MNAPFVRDAPARALLAAAEAFALARFDALNGADPGAADVAFTSWLDGQGDEGALHRLIDGFGFGAGESRLIALLFAAAAAETVARRVAQVVPESGGRGLPVWLAQRLVPDLTPADLAAAGPLRRFEIVAIEGEALRIEARIFLREGLVDRLCGAPPAEPDVAARIVRIRVDAALADTALSGRLAAILAERGRDLLSPLILVGNREPGAVAASLAALGIVPHALRAALIPDGAEARDAFARRWSRDAALDRFVLILILDDNGPASAVAADFVERVIGHVVLVGAAAPPCLNRAVRSVADGINTAPAERWRHALGPARSTRLGPEVARIAAQFRLGPPEIDAVCARVGPEIDAAPDAAAAGRILWHHAGRANVLVPTPGVTVVEPAYGWDDIILAPPVEAALRRIESHVRHATTVMDDWGFAERMGGRGRGVAVLFSGPSGTGKTMAAEVIASALDLRMMVIDLSQIISKYIGETSKNIAAAFDQAERCGAVMVWNEGDAVWGSRGTIGNATDRHINAEVGDLLQRIEAFRGFTIVTTNMKEAIDHAFLRRFRFSIDFHMPSESERLRIWQRAFPARAPIEPIDWSAIAALPLSGGSIRNIALGSAFLAANRGMKIDRSLISAELGEELRKQNLPVPEIAWEKAK